MAASWIKEVAAENIVAGAYYFLAIKDAMGGHLFAARGLNGKTTWAGKPGIARQFIGGEEVKAVMASMPHLVAVEVPADAATRWKARKKRFEKKR